MTKELMDKSTFSTFVKVCLDERRLIEQGNGFFKDIETKGKVLLDGNPHGAYMLVSNHPTGKVP